MSQGTCWASTPETFAPRYESPPKSVQISRYAPAKIHVGTKAHPPRRRSRWTCAKTRIIGAAAGNIIAIIITTQIARNNAAPIPIVRPMPIVFAVLDCQIRSAHDAAVRIRSTVRMRVRSRCKLMVLPPSGTRIRATLACQFRASLSIAQSSYLSWCRTQACTHSRPSSSRPLGVRSRYW